MEVTKTVRALLAELGPVPDADDAPLTLSSLDVVRLAEALERAFACRVFAREVTPANFGTVQALCALVRRKRA